MGMEDKAQHQGTGNVVGPTKEGGGHKLQGEKGVPGARPRVGKDPMGPPVATKPPMSRAVSTYVSSSGTATTSGGGGASDGKDNTSSTVRGGAAGAGGDKEGKSSLKVSAEAADAMVSRLSKVVPKDPDSAIMSVPARDFNDWKRKNAVPPKAQVFAMTG